VKPRLLDLFGGAGGAAKGYADAGFEVVGVDLVDQPNYPFEFIQDDALRLLGDAGSYSWGWGWWDVPPFDAIHASPPCKDRTPLRAVQSREYDDLVGPTQELLRATGLPYVIENVRSNTGGGAPLLNPIMLCGSSFGLGANGRQLRRHRLFETNFPVMALPCQHEGQPIGVYGTGGGGQMTRGYKARSVEEMGEALGIDWMQTKDELSQAIPPAYCQHIGGYLMAHLEQAVAA
jgi:DNA (cytosine-5)-methyltransferase 1